MRRLRFQPLEPRQMLAVTPLGDEILINDQTHGLQHVDADAEAVAAFDDGSFVAVYEGRGQEDRSGIYVRRFAAAGSPLGSAGLVNTTVNGEQTSPSVATFNDESFVVVWAGRGVGDRHGVFAQWFDSDGNAVGSETLVNTTTGGAQLDPQVASTATGSTIVTWHGVGDGDFNGVFARVFSADRTPLAAEMLVNTETVDEQSNAAVAAAADGSFWITWNSRHQDGSDWGVFAQRFEADGTSVGTELAVNQSTTGSQQQPALAVLADNQVVVAWSERTDAGDDSDAIARRFNSNGQPAGDEFQLNQSVEGHQHNVSVAAASDGQLMAVWSHGVPDGSGWEVHGREFDETDAPIDDSFAVNDETSGANSGHQYNPTIAIGGGQAVVVWTGNGALDRAGVHGRRFTSEAIEPNAPPNLAPIDEQQATVDSELEVTVTATDADTDDELTFFLDLDNSPDGATLEQEDNNTAVIRWIPTADDLPGPVLFRVLVVDDGTPPLSDSEDFIVNVNDEMET